MRTASGSFPHRIDLDAATREMLACLADFGRVLEAGSIDERRRVIRAFVKEIRLDPSRSEGRAELFVLPDVAATGIEPAASSLYMVAGAGFGTLCNWPGAVVERYAYEKGRLRRIA